jgi:hypothetical protein
MIPYAMIPYVMQSSDEVACTGLRGRGRGTVKSGSRQVNVTCRTRSPRQALVGFQAGARAKIGRRAQSLVKTCGNLSQSKAELRWAAKSSHLDAAIQDEGIAHGERGDRLGVKP